MWNSTPVAVKKMTLPKYNLQMFKKITDELLVEVELYSVGWQKHGRALITCYICCFNAIYTKNNENTLFISPRACFCQPRSSTVSWTTSASCTCTALRPSRT